MKKFYNLGAWFLSASSITVSSSLDSCDVSSSVPVRFNVNWFRCCPPRVGQLVKTTVTTAVIG